MFAPGQATCLFAQYTPSGRLPPHTRRYLAALAALGFTLHIAISGATAVTPEDDAWLRALGASAHPRANAGLDFGAWADLLRAGRARGAETVLLANDSVFGPYGDLAPLISRMRERDLDAWGMVESHERVRHLQSWFLMLRASSLVRPAVARVFAQDFAAMTKAEIILHGELGLSAALEAENLRIGSVFASVGRLHRLLPANPSHFDWRLMLRAGIPFLKAELLRDNPADIAWLAPLWRRALAGLPGNGVAEIEAALGHGFVPPGRPFRLGRRLLHCLLTQDRGVAVLYGLGAVGARGVSPRATRGDSSG